MFFFVLFVFWVSFVQHKKRNKVAWGKVQNVILEKFTDVFEMKFVVSLSIFFKKKIFVFFQNSEFFDHS